MRHLVLSTIFALLSSSVLAQKHDDLKLANRAIPSLSAAIPTANAQLVDRQQIPFQFCPEQVGQPQKSCADCGGDSNVAGFCNNILLNGPQNACPPGGCGVYCQCTPVANEPPFPAPTGQVPFQVCPEAVGQPKKQCSDCGGDSKMAGVCNDILLNGQQDSCLPPGCGYYCQCDNGDVGSTSTSSPAPETTSTELPPSEPSTTESPPSEPPITEPPPAGPTELVSTVVNGETITGTYTITTLSEWKDLRSHTTITTTTEVDSKETEVVVAIFAGGVAWWLLGASGGAAAVLAPPPEAPEGSEQDDQTCSPEPKCSDDNCGGKNTLGLCSAGDKQNCPCEEEKECPAEPPKCSSEECGGDNGNGKCKADSLEGCQCCPDEPPQCSDEGCDGKDGKCEGEKFKGCSCGNRKRGPPPLPLPAIPAADIGSIDNVAFELFQDIYGGDESLLYDNKEDKPPGKLTCSEDKDSLKIASRYDVGGGQGLSPNDLMYRMREVLCNDKCELPADIPEKAAVATPDGGGCEIAIAVFDNVEAYAYRSTRSQGSQWQNCWDSFANITDTCAQDKPNVGWVNGPDEFEFFQAGFRKLNGDGNKHGSHPLNAADGLASKDAPPSPPPSDPSPTAAPIFPSKRDGSIDCKGSDTSPRPIDCLWPAGSAIVQGQRLDPSIQICTSDPDKNCIKHGQNKNENGEVLGNWCVVLQSGSCAFVIADKDPHFGGTFTGNSCISGQNLIDMSIKGANQCAPGPADAITAGPVQFDNIPAQSLCLTSRDHPEKCAVF